MPDVRPALREDIPPIIALHERCWRVNYAGLADADAKFARGVEEWTRLWLELLDRTSVVAPDGAIAGFVVSGPARDADAAPDTGEIYALYIDPDRQGGGYGRVLVDHVVEALREAGFVRLTLWTFEHNPASRGFYERLGFTWDGTSTRDDDGPIVRYVRSTACAA